jgi:hypothetical protein
MMTLTIGLDEVSVQDDTDQDVWFLTKGIFYVYELIDSLSNQVIYVGKGSRKRIFDHYKKSIGNTKDIKLLYIEIRRIIKNGGTIIHKFAKYFICKEDAFAYEKVLIAQHGRRDLGTGVLVNQTEGGSGPAGYFYKTKRIYKNKRPAKSEAEKELLRARFYPTAVGVKAFDKTTKEPKGEFKSFRAASRALGVAAGEIWRIYQKKMHTTPKTGKQYPYKSAGGYVFEFVEPFLKSKRPT